MTVPALLCALLLGAVPVHAAPTPCSPPADLRTPSPPQAGAGEPVETRAPGAPPGSGAVRPGASAGLAADPADRVRTYTEARASARTGPTARSSPSPALRAAVLPRVPAQRGTRVEECTPTAPPVPDAPRAYAWAEGTAEAGPTRAPAGFRAVRPLSTGCEQRPVHAVDPFTSTGADRPVPAVPVPAVSAVGLVSRSDSSAAMVVGPVPLPRRSVVSAVGPVLRWHSSAVSAVRPFRDHASPLPLPLPLPRPRPLTAEAGPERGGSVPALPRLLDHLIATPVPGVPDSARTDPVTTPRQPAAVRPAAGDPEEPAVAPSPQVRPVSGARGPTEEPTTAPAVVPSGGPEAPEPDEEGEAAPVARPTEAEWGGGAGAEPGAVQMVHHVSTTPAPAETVARFVGNASTVLLALLGVTVLALRLTVGWPRFPEPYLGRRRSGGDPDDR
ncbi:hypothetical protein SAMN05421803_11894 [Nocardiopsis flavescens]|uniref:Meckel syndrome type 1 protein n=2 Tax=Nocardiopsis flavescens TaxID=758803 RepID=A0A1M6RWV0_9ACTN|nr:hypothetical protein SAMN05421803_11894 [Nocardiopsis flavescens]